MAKRKFPVPSDHRSMVSAIKNLPDLSISLWTYPQIIALENRKDYWCLVGQRIDYLELKSRGFNRIDPLEAEEIHPEWRELTGVLSYYDFATLNLMIDQFKTIKDTAIEERRNFPFTNARELFTKRCRELANSEMLEEIGSRDVNRGDSLTKERVRLTELNAFFRGRLEEDKERELLTGFRTHEEWCVFWMYPVWRAVKEA